MERILDLMSGDNNTLYFIGNGFDLFHKGVKSKFIHFYSWLNLKDEEHEKFASNMESIFQTIHSKNPHADVVVTAVSLETLHESVNCFERHGKYPEIVKITGSRTKKIASHTMLQGMNPVFIISGRLT